MHPQFLISSSLFPSFAKIPMVHNLHTDCGINIYLISSIYTNKHSRRSIQSVSPFIATHQACVFVVPSFRFIYILEHCDCKFSPESYLYNKNTKGSGIHFLELSNDWSVQAGRWIDTVVRNRRPWWMTIIVKAVKCFRDSVYMRTYYWPKMNHSALPEPLVCRLAMPNPHWTNGVQSCDPKNVFLIHSCSCHRNKILVIYIYITLDRKLARW